MEHRVVLISVGIAIALFHAFVIYVCASKILGRIKKIIKSRTDGRVTTTTTPISLLEVKVTLPMKVIYRDTTVAKKSDPPEMAQIPKTRLGEGTLGTLFKVVLDCGTIVTIRKIRAGLIKDTGNFELWTSFFGRIKDDLLLPIHFSFWYGGEAFILYEYLILGSLEELLHGNDGIQFTPLKWEIRKQIALCAAKAVNSLHSRVTMNGQALVCGVIKASNILIKTDFSACLSSYETPYLVPPEMIIKRNPGRVAPELKKHSRIFTHKSDVYSFGILLLELMTGERPSVTNLRDYVREKKREEGLNSICDKRMGEVKENMVGMIGIALLCLSRNPQDRPSMDKVVQMIQVL